MFFGRMYNKVNKQNNSIGTNIFDGFNYNTNLDIAIENINNKQKSPMISI